MSPAVLKVQDLTVSYGSGVPEVVDASLEVAAGEILGIVGANGAGKTSLLKGIAGLAPVSSGLVELDGRRLDDLPVEKRVTAGLVLLLEGKRAFTTLTVEDNLVLAYARRKKADDQVGWLDKTYESFPVLSRLRAQTASSLSGGEQQLLALARALALDPRALLLDEPSLGLSPQHISTVFEMVERIALSGVAVILVEQNVEWTRRIASAISVMLRGRIHPPKDPNSLSHAELQAAYFGREETEEKA